MAVELKYVARGIGGVDEMSLHLDDTKVLFGILRFVFGKGTFARIKYVAVHFVGSKCPIVKQGRANAQKNAAMEALGLAACELPFETPDQCNVDAVLAILHRVVVVDDPALGADGETPTFQKMTVATMREDVEAQLAAAKALQAAKEAEAAAARAAAPRVMVRVPRGNMTLRDLGKTLTLKEALPHVRSDAGQLNWILVTADPSWPEVVNGGAGSVPELLRSLEDDQVYFGLLRAAFGKGHFRRCKWVFVHWSGENVSALKRGKLNGAEAHMRKVFGATNLDHFAAAREEISVEIIVEKVRKFVVTDGEARDEVERLYGLDAFYEALEEETVAAAEEFDVPVDEVEKETAETEAREPTFQEAMESVRSDGEPQNWLLAEL